MRERFEESSIRLYVIKTNHFSVRKGGETCTDRIQEVLAVALKVTAADHLMLQ
jgi:hypothetical protein